MVNYARICTNLCLEEGSTRGSHGPASAIQLKHNKGIISGKLMRCNIKKAASSAFFFSSLPRDIDIVQ